MQRCFRCSKPALRSPRSDFGIGPRSFREVRSAMFVCTDAESADEAGRWACRRRQWRGRCHTDFTR
eukprot:856457-Alexandrium_andersonii.AAC.1